MICIKEIPRSIMQSLRRSKLGSALLRINTAANNYSVRHISCKDSVAKYIPKKPAKPKDAIDRFLKDVEPQIKAENSDYSNQEMRAIAREMWRELSSEAKLSYKAAARRDIEEYNEACKLYACSLSDEQSAATLLKRERRIQSTNLRALRDKLKETGRPGRPVPAFALFATDLKTKSACEACNPMEYNQKVKLIWKQLSVEEKSEYLEKAREKLKRQQEELSEWGKKISEPFSKWTDIQAIATAQKTMEDFERPVKPPTALMLFIEKVQAEESDEMNFSLENCMLRWDVLEQKEKDSFIAEAQRLHDDYEKKLDDWNNKMSKSLGSWADKIRSERS